MHRIYHLLSIKHASWCILTVILVLGFDDTEHQNTTQISLHWAPNELVSELEAVLQPLCLKLGAILHCCSPLPSNAEAWCSRTPRCAILMVHHALSLLWDLSLGTLFCHGHRISGFIISTSDKGNRFYLPTDESMILVYT